MKVSKPPSGLVSGHPVGLPAAGTAGAKGFADKLAKASGSDKARAATATQPGAQAGRAPGIADIAKALKAGQITPQAALDRVSSKSYPARWVARDLPQSGRSLVQHSAKRWKTIPCWWPRSERWTRGNLAASGHKLASFG